MEDLTGKQFGPYRIVAPLGEGGMAAVYKAFQANMDRYVALKILPRTLASDPQFMGRFQQEAKVLAKLQHPHILPVHDFGEAGGYTYIVMPFVETGTLGDLLRGEPLPLRQIRSIVSQVGDALDYAHSLGVVHRDVKPSNILIDQRGNCLLTDFGIAKIVGGTTTYTQTGAVIGTPAYMSPEQIRGDKLDGRSDIYSLGVVLYEMATGRPPYRAETPPAVFVKHLHDPLPPPHTHNPNIPPEVEQAILKALTKERDDRYQTAAELTAALSRPARAPRPPAAPAAQAAQREPAPAAPKPPPKGRRRYLIWALVVFGLLAVCGLACVLSGALRLAMQRISQPAPTPTATQPAVTPTPVLEESVVLEPTAAPPPSPSASATLLPTPTTIPTRTPTGSASPIPTRTFTALPSETPTRLPTRTFTPVPTRTPTPTPTAEECPFAIYDGFRTTWLAFEDQLGCPLSTWSDDLWMAREEFEGGRMFWRSDNDLIYVVYSGGTWRRYANTWQEGDPEFSCGTPESPPTPKRGFGKVWCSYSQVSHGLGNATTGEWGEHNDVQDFAGGWMLRAEAGTTYTFFNDGTWR